MRDKIVRRTGQHHLSTSFATFRPHIDNIVRLPDDLEVVLNHNYCVALFHQRLQHVQQFFNVCQVQPGRWLIENIYGLGLRRTAQLIRQFNPLCLATGQRVARLP